MIVPITYAKQIEPNGYAHSHAPEGVEQALRILFGDGSFDRNAGADTQEANLAIDFVRYRTHLKPEISSTPCPHAVSDYRVKLQLGQRRRRAGSGTATGFHGCIRALLCKSVRALVQNNPARYSR